jgi:hypothetical protein
MELKKRISYSLIFSLVVFVIALFTTLVPCSVSPNVPNPQFSLKLCSFNPDFQPGEIMLVKYFGFTESLMDAYLVFLVGIFLISFFFLKIFKEKGK